MSRVNFVIVESPYAPPKGATPEQAAIALARNLAYVRAAMHDCFSRGEVPFASHALFTQEGVLDDTVPAQRKQGIEGGFFIAQALHAASGMSPSFFSFMRAFYSDRGFSSGMMFGKSDAIAGGQDYEVRFLGSEWGVDKDCEYVIIEGMLVRKL
jgi:hypothetical protein